MKRSALIAISLALSAGTAGAGQRMVEGVPWDVVDWETLCKNVKPLVYTSSSGQVCRKVHPADTVWKKWEYGPFPDKPEPKINCKAVADRYEQKRRNIAGCKSAFGAALTARAREPDAFEESFKVWRARYFDPWIQGD